MKIYVVVNDAVRTSFEKFYQLPYGYHSMPIFFSEDDAMKFLKSMEPNIRRQCVVESVESGERETVFHGIFITE